MYNLFKEIIIKLYIQLKLKRKIDFFFKIDGWILSNSFLFKNFVWYIYIFLNKEMFLDKVIIKKLEVMDGYFLVVFGNGVIKNKCDFV